MSDTDSENSQAPSKKVLIMGLDNSGKTSILLSLTKTTNLLSYFSIKPTKGIQISSIEDGERIVKVWDFGGQKSYRNDYLQNMDQYIEGIDELIYVIDIQDRRRYDEALEYFKNILKAIGKPERKIDLTIYFHKFDPLLDVLEEYSTQTISLKLVGDINAIATPTYDPKIFKTSIYTIFQKKTFQ